MQTRFSEESKIYPAPKKPNGSCAVACDCGFCNATCPTYQLLGDELDGPRGRIYLIKQVLEGQPATASTQLHLDRCLSCRNCETTCPSGVDYHNLLDIGRAVVDQAVPRPAGQRALRLGLRSLATSPDRFKALLRIGAIFRPLLPANLSAKLPRPSPPHGERPPLRHRRTVLMLEGCVQPGSSPNTNTSAARVLDRLRHQRDQLCAGRLLWRPGLSPRRPGHWAGSRPTEYRRLVAHTWKTALKPSSRRPAAARIHQGLWTPAGT